MRINDEDMKNDDMVYSVLTFCLKKVMSFMHYMAFLVLAVGTESTSEFLERTSRRPNKQHVVTI